MKILLIGVFLCSITSCELYNIDDPGALVPPTSDQDPQLPQITIDVAGYERSIHLQTFGVPANPPVFVLHGGPGADFRMLLPLKALADSFFVVMWDSRGAGLSERVSKEELTIDSFNEELAEVKAAFSPDEKATFIGHSFGGNVMAVYNRCLLSA